MLEKISTPKDCCIRLKAEMNDYRGINECKFLVQAIFDSPLKLESAGSKHSLMLSPLTPNKKNKSKEQTTAESSANSDYESPETDAEMDSDNSLALKLKED